jgi:sterol 14-demethylase
MDLIFYILGSIALFLAFTFFYFSRQPAGYPPIYHYAWNALSGKYAMKDNGPVKLFEEGYKAKGEIYTLNVGYRRVTMMLGPDAAASFFTQRDTVVSQREVYKFTVPVFGPNIVYDSPLKTMYEQLKFIKHGLIGPAMREHSRNIISETVNYFSDWPDSGEIDLHDTMSKLTILTASRCLLGEEIRNTLHDQVADLYQDLSDGMTHLTFFFPNFPCEKHRKRDHARREMVKIFSKSIEARRANPRPANSDLLQVFIDSDYDNGRKLTTEEICGLLLAALFAGQHTSTITATWCGLNIMRDQETHLPILLEEQKRVLAEHKGEVNHASLEDMIYLTDCVRETLRMYPPLTSLMREVTQDFKFKEYTVPKGDIVMTCPSVNHHLDTVFTNPSKFDPARFDKNGRHEDKTPFAFNAFGAGRHVCLGRTFGLLQIKAIWSTLLRTYDFEMMSEMPEIDYAHLVAGPKHPTMVRYKKKSVPL